MRKNMICLMLMRILKKAINIFTDSFFVLYFMQLTNNNILPLGIYYLFLYTALIISVLMIKNFLKSKNRVWILRIGVVLNFIYFLIILFLKDKITEYAWLLGILYGVEEGLYYSVFNVYESEINKDKIKEYIGNYNAICAVISVIIPLIFGSIMSYSGFGKCTLIVLLLVIIKIIITIIYNELNIPKQRIVNLKKYFNEIKKNKLILRAHFVSFSNGLTYSGAFNILVTIYIIRMFRNSFFLGVLTSVFSIITAIASFLFAKYVVRYSYKKIIIFSNLLVVIFLLVMMLKCNSITIIIFNFIQSFAKTYASLINENNLIVVANSSQIKKEFREEYYVTHEIYIYIGRIISYFVFCLLAFSNNILFTNIVMISFVIFLIIRMITSLKLQKSIDDFENK